MKDSRPSLVWVRERTVDIDPHMLAMLLGTTHTSHQTHHGFDHLKFHSWQWAWALLSRFIDRSWAVSMVVKSPWKFKKTYGDLRSCRSSDETLEKRLELYPHKRRRLFLCLREYLASRYSARTLFLRVYIEVFLKRFTRRFHTRSSFASRKTYT